LVFAATRQLVSELSLPARTIPSSGFYFPTRTSTFPFRARISASPFPARTPVSVDLLLLVSACFFRNLLAVL